MKKRIKYVMLIFSLLSLIYKNPYDYYQIEEANKKEGRFLSIPNTSIYEPLVQGEDNAYYLTHDATGNKNKLGAIFLDYRTTLEDRVLLIYGHNSKTYAVPFQELENFYEEDYGKEHDMIKIIDKEKIYQYKLFSVFVAYDDFFYMELPKTNEEYQLYLNHIEKASWFTFEEKESKKEKILIMQTCSYHPKYKKYKNKYLLLVAYLDCIFS